MEPLGIQLRKSLKGIETNGINSKCSQYADDTSMYIKDYKDLERGMGVLKEFKYQSAMKVNMKKSSIIYLGKKKFKRGKYNKIPVVEKDRYLGVQVEKQKQEQNLVEKYFKVCSERTLLEQDPLSKTYIANAFGVGTLAFAALYLEISEAKIKSIKQAYWNFIWSGKQSYRIAQEKAIAKREDGGLGALKVDTWLKCFLAAWIPIAIWNESSKEANWVKIMGATRPLPKRFGNVVQRACWH